MSHYIWYWCVHVTLHDTSVYISHYMWILVCTYHIISGFKAQNLKHFMIVTEAWVMVERKQLYYIVSCSHLIFLLRVWFTWFLFVALYCIRLHFNTQYCISCITFSPQYTLFYLQDQYIYIHDCIKEALQSGLSRRYKPDPSLRISAPPEDPIYENTPTS